MSRKNAFLLSQTSLPLNRIHILRAIDEYSTSGGNQRCSKWHYLMQQLYWLVSLALSCLTAAPYVNFVIFVVPWIFLIVTTLLPLNHFLTIFIKVYFVRNRTISCNLGLCRNAQDSRLPGKSRNIGGFRLFDIALKLSEI